MHLTEYTALVRDLAQRHKRVLADAANKRFLRILISADPVQKQLDLTSFYNALRSQLKAPAGQPFVVLENYQVDYGDNDGDYLARQLHGAYFVLAGVKPGDDDGRDVAIAECELIGEQLLAAVVYKLLYEHGAYISVREAWTEHIGPIGDNHYGVRVNFSWREPANQELTYNPDAFN